MNLKLTFLVNEDQLKQKKTNNLSVSPTELMQEVNYPYFRSNLTH
jgi:hypothetical protein